MEALKLKFKGNTPVGQSKIRWFSQILEDIKKRVNSWQRIEQES
jgi:hypothetical protein